jgi:hypothetical protein
MLASGSQSLRLGEILDTGCWKKKTAQGIIAKESIEIRAFLLGIRVQIP